MDEGYFVSESITRGALSRNYASVGPSASRGTWVDIINFSLRKRAPVFAEIEPRAYYIGVVPPVKKGDASWKKPLAEMVRFTGRKISGPVTIFHFSDIRREGEGVEDPPEKWLPPSFSKPMQKGIFGTHILISVPYMVSYMERCLEELGCAKISSDMEKGLLFFEHNGRAFELDITGLIKRMAYQGFTKEFLAASIITYVYYGSAQKPGLNAVRRVGFPEEKGIYVFEKQDAAGRI